MDPFEDWDFEFEDNALDVAALLEGEASSFRDEPILSEAEIDRMAALEDEEDDGGGDDDDEEEDEEEEDDESRARSAAGAGAGAGAVGGTGGGGVGVARVAGNGGAVADLPSSPPCVLGGGGASARSAGALPGAPSAYAADLSTPLAPLAPLPSPDGLFSPDLRSSTPAPAHAAQRPFAPLSARRPKTPHDEYSLFLRSVFGASAGEAGSRGAWSDATGGAGAGTASAPVAPRPGGAHSVQTPGGPATADGAWDAGRAAAETPVSARAPSLDASRPLEAAALAASDASRRASLRDSSHSLDPRTRASASAAAAATPCSPGLALSGSLPAVVSLDAAPPPLSTPAADATPAPTLPQPGPLALQLPTPASAHPLANAASAPSAAAASVPSALLADLDPSPGDAPAAKKAGMEAGEDSDDDPDDADWVAQWQSDEDEGEGGADDESEGGEASPKNGPRGDRGAGRSNGDDSGTRRAAGKRASAKQVRQRGGDASLDGGAVAGGPPPASGAALADDALPPPPAGGKRGRVVEARSGEGLPTPQRRRLATVYGAPPLPSASPPPGPPSSGGGPPSQDAAASSGGDAAATGALFAGASSGSQTRPTAAPPASSGPRLRPSSRLPPALAAALRPPPKGPPGALTPADYAAIARQTASHVQLLLQGAALGLAVRGPGAARARRAAAASARLCLALRALAGGRAAARRDVGIPGYNAEAIHLGWVGAGAIAHGEEGDPLGEAGSGQGTTTGAGEAACGSSEPGDDARGRSREPIVPFPLLRDPTYSILDAALFDEAPRFLRAVQAAARAGAGADDEPADGPADPGTSGSGAAGAGQGRGPGASGPGASGSGRTALQASRRLAAASSRPPLPPASSSTLSASVRAPCSSSSSLPLASSSSPPPPPSSSSSSSSNAPGHVAWRHLPRPVRVEWDRLSSLRLTSAGLEPSPPPHARWSLRLFTPAEDALLAIGIRRFAFDWEAIASTLLPGKSAEQARVRRKNLAALKPLRKPLHPGAVAVREASDRLLRPLSDAEIALLQAFAPKLEGVKGRWEALCATAFAERDPNVTARLWAAHLDQRGAGGRAKGKARSRGKAKGTAGGAGQRGPRHDDATAARAADAERDAGTGLGMGNGDATRRAAEGRAGGGGGGNGIDGATIATTGGLAPTDASACVGTDAAVSARALASAIDRSGAALASIPLPPASLLPSLATPSTGGSPASSPRSDGPAASLFPPAPSPDPSSSSPPALPAHAIRDAGVEAPRSASGSGSGASSPASSPPPSPSARERHLRRRRELAAMRRRGPIRAAFLATGGGGGGEEEGGEEGEEEGEEGGQRGVGSSRGGRWGLEADESGPGLSASAAAASGVASKSGGAAETLSQRPLGRSRASRERELPETSPLGPELSEASLTPMPAHAAFLRTPGEFPSPNPSAFGSQIASGIDAIGGIGGGDAGGVGIAGGLPSDSPLSPVRLSSPGSLPSPVHLASPSALHALFSPANAALERGADASTTLPSLQTPLGAASQRFSAPGGAPLQPQLGASPQRFAPVAAPLQHLVAHGTVPSQSHLAAHGTVPSQSHLAAHDAIPLQPHLAAPGGVPPQAGFPAQLGAFPAAPSGARASASFVSASYYTSSSTAAPTAPPPSSLVPMSSLLSLSASVGVGAASGALPGPLPSTPWPARHYERVEFSSSSEDEADRDEEKSRAMPGTSTLAQRCTRVEARARAEEDKGPPTADHRPPSAAIDTCLLPPEEQRTPISNAAALAPFLALSPEATPSFDPPPATAGAHPAQAPVSVPVPVPVSVPVPVPVSVPASIPVSAPVPVPAPVSALTAFSRDQDRRMLRAVVARNGLLSRADLAALAADVQAPQDRVSERCKQLVARLEARTKA